jgi:uncharacterized protein with ATP-grasp and redox domains
VLNTSLDCLPCIIGQALAAVRRVTPDPDLHRAMLRQVLRDVADMDLSQSPPAMAQKVQWLLRQTTGNPDPYAELKSVYNAFAATLVPELLAQCPDPARMLEFKLRLAIAANVIDFGKNPNLSQTEALASIRASLNAPLDTSAVARLWGAIQGAKSILYLGDNAGEIVFDKVLIEALPNRDSVTYVVRGEPVLNDVTIRDAEEVGLCGLVEVIDNGSDAPGTILEDCSPEFRRRFAAADLIIAKGQGNYETLSSTPHRQLCFLFLIKCAIVATDASGRVGDLAVVWNRYSNGGMI